MLQRHEPHQVVRAERAVWVVSEQRMLHPINLKMTPGPYSVTSRIEVFENRTKGLSY